MKPMDGVSLLKEIIAYDPQAKIIMITGYSTNDSAMEVLKLGAFDYVEKPFRIDDLIDTVNRAISSTGKTEPSDPS